MEAFPKSNNANVTRRHASCNLSHVHPYFKTRFALSKHTKINPSLLQHIHIHDAKVGKKTSPRIFRDTRPWTITFTLSLTKPIESLAVLFENWNTSPQQFIDPTPPANIHAEARSLLRT